MSEFEDEIQAVKNRYRGQCPYEKDHDGYGLPCFMAGVFLTVLFMVIIIMTSAPDREGEAIAHGYAIHNPKTGKFQWQ